MSEFSGLSVHESVYDELVAEKVKAYVDEQSIGNLHKLKIYHDSDLNSDELALLNYYIAKIAVHSLYDPYRDNAKDRGEVKSLSYMAVKQYFLSSGDKRVNPEWGIFVEEMDKLYEGILKEEKNDEYF